MKGSFKDYDAVIKLSTGTCQFIVNDEFSFIKHDNKLFKMTVGSDPKQLMILDSLRQPKQLREIIGLFSKFRKKDIIHFLDRLYALNLIQVENVDDIQNSDSNIVPKKEILDRYCVNSRDIRQLSSSKILLIGCGILANKLFTFLKKNNIHCKQITTIKDTETSQKKKLE